MSVAWVSAGVGLLTVVNSSKNSSKAQDSANRATDASKAAADGATQLGREQLDFTKQQYADAAPYREQAARTAQQVAEAQLRSQEQNDALAKDYSDYQKSTFRPVEQGIVADAQGYDTPEKRQKAAEAAMGDVSSNFARTNEARGRQLAASGINPGSARAMAAMAGTDVEEAKALAGAASNARNTVETTGFARKMDAASLGRNLNSNQATSAGIALNAGNSAVNNSMNGVNAVNSGVGAVQSGYTGAINANTGAGSLYSNAASIYGGIANSENASLGALGNVAGRWASSDSGSKTLSSAWDGMKSDANDAWNWIKSDEEVKEDIQPQDPEEALEEVVSTPVSNWKYSPAKLAQKGMPMPDEGGQPHTGPMAQDVQETMGDEVAPGGKKIDLISMNGKTMLAVQALDKKINKLASLIGSGKLEVAA